jgi:hypothetical protein
MRNHDEQHHRSPQDVPPVGRPRGATWRSLQADGVVWEGQVLLVGEEVDLAARMIVTHRRVAFVRGGELVLEIPRGWLRQEPVLRRDGVLELFVAMPESNPFEEPMRVPLRMREGHPAAGHIIAMLAPGGVRRIAPDTMSAIERAREAAPTPIFGGFWDGIDGVEEGQRSERAPANLTSLPPVEPPDRLVRVPSNPPRQPLTNAYPIAGLRPRDQRRSHWTLALRLVAVTGLLAAAAALGAGRLNLQLPVPGTDAVLTAPTQTVSGTVPDAAADTSTETVDPALATTDQVALEIGVGGPAVRATDTPGNAPELSSAGAVEPAIAPTKPAIPTPAPAIADPPATTDSPEAAVVTTTTGADETDQAASPDAVDPVAADQTAVVAPGADPAQGIAAGPFQMAITTALRAETLPKYGLPPGSGEWVLLIADLANEGNAAASLAMSDVRLVDRGTGVAAELDGGTEVIASLAGIKPARSASDAIAIDPGETTTSLFLFLLPEGSGDDLALQIGESAFDLAPSLAASAEE